MLFEYVFVKELKTGTTKNNKTYPIIISGVGETWRLFNGEHVEINKSYTIGYELSDDGNNYKNIKQVIPLQNVFLQQALKEVSSKSDIIRNLTVCLSYIKDLVIADKVQYENMFPETEALYAKVIAKADSEYDKINNNPNVPQPKDIKIGGKQ